MKKILISFIIMFLFINTVNAQTIEEQLNDLQTNIKSLKEKVTDLTDNRLDKTYPIGSIYITTVHSTIDKVSDAIGGTWEKYGKGKTLVGVDESDDEFNAVNKTGGSSTTTLKVENLPNHTHNIPLLSGTTTLGGVHNHSIPKLNGITNTTGNHVHTYVGSVNSTSYGANHALMYTSHANNWGASMPGSSAGNHSHTVTTNESQTGDNGEHTHDVTISESETESTGEGTPFTNLQPYITVYMYKRVA